MTDISEGPAYTKGNSFRAQAEKNARLYRSGVLRLGYGKHAHWLADGDAAEGWNFLPSMRQEVLSAVHKRHAAGKGVDLSRTLSNMLSSQAMCFNLFVPLIRNKTAAAHLFDALIGGVGSIDTISIEYTPSNAIFGDQTSISGVDCDALVRYTNQDGESALLVIETKYVEPEFSNCKYRNHKTDPCPDGTLVSDDLGFCRYQTRNHFYYWEVSRESNLFDMDSVLGHTCPFRGSLWQLWLNMTLAYGIARSEGVADFRYLVICPERNAGLSNNGQVFTTFRQLLVNPDRFAVVYLESIIKTMLLNAVGTNPPEWVTEFAQRYGSYIGNGE